MLAHAPRTLWRYIFVEMWKLILLTAAVLMTVVSFAMVVKPLADGKLGPADAVRFMVMAMPVAVQYTLPFAACFGATLSLYRLASENELTACHAGGISHRSVLVPALVTGLALALGLLVLSNYAIPRFLKSMQDLVTQDVTRLITAPIERGEAVQIQGQYLYADQVRRTGPDRQAGAYQTLFLAGVLFVKPGDDGQIETQGIAQQAYVQFKRAAGDDGRTMTEIVLRAMNAVLVTKDGKAQLADVIRRERVPDPSRDNPKFLTFGELRDVRERPEALGQIDAARHGLALTLGQHLIIDSVRASLQKTGRAELVRTFPAATGSGQVDSTVPVVVRAGNIRPMRNQPRAYSLTPLAPGEPIVVEERTADGQVRRQSAARARVRLPEPGVDQPQGRATLTLELLDVSAELVNPDVDLEAPTPDAIPVGANLKWMIDGLSPATDPAAGVTETPTWALMELARKRVDAGGRDQEALSAKLARLESRVDDLLREVFSKEQERYAYAAACLIMVLCGAVMAMRLRDSLPLTIYMWAFFPALAAVVCISAGQQLTHGAGPLGLLVLWGGVAALTVFTGVQFTRLARH
jgi:lipopolysaccharide export LptBFGC system permease protein LptF